jgi:hypothetical protein
MRNHNLWRVAPQTLIAWAIAPLFAAGSDPAAAQVPFLSVNATHDAIDANPGDGVCADARGACTLRAAVMEANVGGNGIGVMAGTVLLTIPGAGEDAALTGDLDITRAVGITGLVHRTR